jgi:hypothetical protein
MIKNMYILKLLPNVVTDGNEAFLSGNKLLYACVKEVCRLWAQPRFALRNTKIPRRAIQNKRRGMLTSGVMLHYDNVHSLALEHCCSISTGSCLTTNLTAISFQAPITCLPA